MTGLSLRLIRLADEARLTSDLAGLGQYSRQRFEEWRHLRAAVSATLGPDVAAAMSDVPERGFHPDWLDGTESGANFSIRLMFAGLAEIYCEWGRIDGETWVQVPIDGQAGYYFYVPTDLDVTIGPIKTLGEALCVAQQFK